MHSDTHPFFSKECNLFYHIILSEISDMIYIFFPQKCNLFYYIIFIDSSLSALVDDLKTILS